MIKIVSYTNRKFTEKNLRKIWNMFPNDEFCFINIPYEYLKLQWTKRIIKYCISRGKKISVEIDAINQFDTVEELLELGVNIFYFIWRGIYKNIFLSSLDIITYSINIINRYPNIKIYIIYNPPYNSITVPLEEEKIETSLSFLSYSIKEYDNINGIFRRPHPWFGKKRSKIINEAEKIINNFDNIYIENKCGCLTILPNTNIYCCPFCERKDRKRLFGNADRDKYVVGTIDRGIFRNINCNWCDSKKGKTLHTPIGGE